MVHSSSLPLEGKVPSVSEGQVKDRGTFLAEAAPRQLLFCYSTLSTLRVPSFTRKRTVRPAKLIA